MYSHRNTYVRIVALVVILLVVTFAVAAAYGTPASSDSTSTREVTYRTALLDERVEAREATWVRVTNERHLVNSMILINTAERIAAEKAHAATHTHRATTTRPSRRASAVTPGNGRCGGSLPPCYVMMRESGGNLTAKNPRSTASGKWQALNPTWNGFGGYSEAWQAPEAVQDAFAAQLWAGGSGCSHWAAC